LGSGQLPREAGHRRSTRRGRKVSHFCFFPLPSTRHTAGFTPQKSTDECPLPRPDTVRQPAAEAIFQANVGKRRKIQQEQSLGRSAAWWVGYLAFDGDEIDFSGGGRVLFQDFFCPLRPRGRFFKRRREQLAESARRSRVERYRPAWPRCDARESVRQTVLSRLDSAGYRASALVSGGRTLLGLVVDLEVAVHHVLEFCRKQGRRRSRSRSWRRRLWHCLPSRFGLPLPAPSPQRMTHPPPRSGAFHDRTRLCY